MKNLKLFVSLKYALNNVDNCQHLAVSTFDFNKNIFLRGGSNFLYKDGKVYLLIPGYGRCKPALDIKQNPVNIKNTKSVALFYNSVLNTLNIALEAGDVLAVPLDHKNNLIANEIKLVGSIVVGLKSATLSPDSETVVLLSSNNDVIVMSGHYELIEEIDLFGSDQGEQEMVNVGWGKKETQFHGSEGKAAAKKTVSEEECHEFIEDGKARTPHISWRGDSSLFAVNYWCPEKYQHKVKIFDKSGILQCTSEFLPGLGNSISWKPSGNLIALTQTLPNKQVVCFMEKNGLRHGEFTLPQDIKVLELSWNSESTILSAVCHDESLNQPCVLLWTMKNYHWYLKQKLVYHSPVVALVWDDVIANLAHVLLANGTFHLYQWVWTVDHSAGVTDDDLAAVAVIDGCDVKLTAFKKCVIPPPMCSATITLPCPILQIIFAPHCGPDTESDPKLSPNNLLVYLSDGSLGLIKGLETTPQLQGVFPLQWDCKIQEDTPSGFSHWTWLSRERLICLIQCDGTYICEVQLGDNTATIVSTIDLGEPVLTVSHQSGGISGFMQLSSGELFEYEDSSVTPHSCLPEICTAFRCIGPHMFARDHNNRMYVDGELVATNVTSFYCLPRFLVMTLSNHQLCITNIDSGFKVLEGEDTSRRVERGARLVVCANHSVILQMPRGNLETVEPRALTLVTAAALLDSGDYAAVAKLLRRQRINLNLCVDHNPSLFLLSVPRFVAQVQDPQWLSVFVAELNDQDVTRTMYKGFYNNQTGRGPPLADKVKRVCYALREAMRSTEEDRARYQQPILSSLVREGRIDEAIAVADSDQAISYLTLLIDTERLYEAALGAYNLDKALKIAGKSLKDPKEYVVYLNKLREMDPPYMKFTIDRRLRKRESALHNLAQCSDRIEECLQYVQETGLYSLGLELFKDQPQVYKQICLLYGSWLLKQGSKQEAGLMLSRGEDIKGAVGAYSRAGCWRQCLSLAAQHGYSDAEVAELSESLYSTLISSDQPAEAAQLCMHRQWWDRAINCWVEAHCWSHAMHLCHMHQHKDLLESNVKPALLETQARTLADMRARCEDLDKHTARLLVVREKKASMDRNFDAMSDIQSDTSSLSSFSTSSSGSRTTKNSRKAQRKLWSLKEGNPREEQALLFNISQLIQSTEKLTGEVQPLCLALAEFGLDGEGRSLHLAMATALEHVEKAKFSVWPASAVKKSGSDADSIDPTEIDTQLSYPPPTCISTGWKLNIFS